MATVFERLNIRRLSIIYCFRKKCGIPVLHLTRRTDFQVKVCFSRIYTFFNLTINFTHFLMMSVSSAQHDLYYCSHFKMAVTEDIRSQYRSAENAINSIIELINCDKRVVKKWQETALSEISVVKETLTRFKDILVQNETKHHEPPPVYGKHESYADATRQSTNQTKMWLF
ncbi:hypothetical protein C0J52_03275 [Blattella germanica]|nr:hypothetical protein C0J52_03275 [Blattella germanica]